MEKCESSLGLELIKALDSITWYNDIYPALLQLKNDLINFSGGVNYLKINDKLEPKHAGFDDRQFEIFWMILVILFGDYGTSPRSGWLHLRNKKDIIEFIDKITITGREEHFN